MLEKVDLDRYQVAGILGTGADYEVRAALDQQTGEQVALKRPKPQMVSRRLHDGIEARTDRMLQAYHEVGCNIPTVVPCLGYTDRTVHDAYFGESLGEKYRVLVVERAKGIPLVGDPMARITGVPIGVGQNLFSLFPLVRPAAHPRFAIHHQLLDIEESFFQAGYILLDLRPQNVFYQPATGKITVIDCGALACRDGAANPRGRPAPGIHDFYLEMLKFYTTPQQPPEQPNGYREPYGLRPVVRFEQELDEMASRFSVLPEPARGTAIHVIGKVRSREYTEFGDFRQDLIEHLETMTERNRSLPNYSRTLAAWSEALEWLRGEYWRRFLFDPELDLAEFHA